MSRTRIGEASVHKTLHIPFNRSLYGLDFNFICDADFLTISSRAKYAWCCSIVFAISGKKTVFCFLLLLPIKRKLKVKTFFRWFPLSVLKNEIRNWSFAFNVGADQEHGMRQNRFLKLPLPLRWAHQRWKRYQWLVSIFSHLSIVRQTLAIHVDWFFKRKKEKTIHAHIAMANRSVHIHTHVRSTTHSRSCARKRDLWCERVSIEKQIVQHTIVLRQLHKPTNTDNPVMFRRREKSYMFFHRRGAIMTDEWMKESAAKKNK